MRTRNAVLLAVLAVLVVAPSASAAVWPGGGSVSFADTAGTLTTEISGLAYQSAGNGTKGVLWAVKNDAATLYRLVHDGTNWVPDTANGWAAGKTLRFPDSSGNPDAEGVTVVPSDSGVVYVSVERNDVNAGNSKNISRPSVLRYDVTQAGGTLVATNEWALVADLPGLAANAGLEAVTWVPDSALMARGFVDATTGVAYDPADYPNHGTGLFFVGVEATGEVRAYALRPDGDAFSKVATISGGFGEVMGLEFDTATNLLWVTCDDNCQGQSRTFAINDAGVFAAVETYARPSGMANLNTEGFAITGTDECVDGVRPVYWADDDGTDNHALRAGTLSLGCTVPQTPGDTGTPQPPSQPPVTPAGPATTLPLPVVPVAPRDLIKPTVTGFKATRSSVTFTLSEAAKVTVTVEKRSGRRYRKVKTFTVSGKLGKQTVKLSPKVSARQTRRGKLRIGVVATDAVGNRSVVARETIG